MGDALRVSGLRKKYKRRGPWALDGMECAVPRGSICGLVGPNGAGKTTLYSVVCGFLPPDAGSVDVLGEGPFDPFVHKGRVGVLPQDAGLPARQTCADFLLLMGRLQGLSAADARRDVDQRLRQVSLHDRRTDPVESLSHGMRRRLSVASALLGSPELVMLDEPMAGLDPVQAAGLRDVLISLRGKTTLLVSSHNLGELERICDRVVLMDSGRLVQQGTVAEITAQGSQVTWELGPGAVPLDALRAALPGHTFSTEDSLDGHRLRQTAPPAELDGSSTVVAATLAAAGLAIRGVQRGRSLEASFLAGREPTSPIS